MDQETGEVVEGLRKRGKSKEKRPNPIVQMGMLQPLEEKLHRRFGMTDFIVYTDAGLGSESNRRYNMGKGRDYICVQSLPSLKEEKTTRTHLDARPVHLSRQNRIKTHFLTCFIAMVIL